MTTKKNYKELLMLEYKNENGKKYKDERIIADELVYLVNFLEQEGEIDFALCFRSDDGDYWLQSEHYSKKICKTIVWDYDERGSYITDERGTAIEQLADYVYKTQKAIEKFEKSISINK